MLTKITSFIAAALVFSGTTVYAVPAAGSNVLQPKAENASPNVSVCTGNTPNGCITISVSSDSCVNFTGGRSFLDKEVSSAVIPAGFVCTFYEQFGCLSSQGGQDAVVLQGGTWSFFAVPGVAGTVNFNDLSSSFICSPA
ncbi:hypothetical protein AN958_09302 [Leucoagaricus sp. SymC.cos]|nr:hypothetical protein AN958_09302 [Leucoagaricus sp. SymC.cos]